MHNGSPTLELHAAHSCYLSDRQQPMRMTVTHVFRPKNYDYCRNGRLEGMPFLSGPLMTVLSLLWWIEKWQNKFQKTIV